MKKIAFKDGGYIVVHNKDLDQYKELPDVVSVKEPSFEEMRIYKAHNKLMDTIDKYTKMIELDDHGRPPAAMTEYRYTKNDLLNLYARLTKQRPNGRPKGTKNGTVQKNDKLSETQTSEKAEGVSEELLQNESPMETRGE